MTSYCVPDLRVVHGFTETVEEQNEGIRSALGRCSSVNGSPNYIIVEQLLLDCLESSLEGGAQFAFEFCGNLDHAGPLAPIELEECFQQNLGRLAGNGLPVHLCTVEAACDNNPLT